VEGEDMLSTLPGQTPAVASFHAGVIS